MTDAEKKLKQLQNCLGEKKLKQLGLIPCTTCREIMTKVMNISLPIDLQNKPFFTSEEMSTISQTIMESVNYSLNDPTSSILTSPSNESLEDESINEVVAATSENDTLDTSSSDSDDEIVASTEDNEETASEDESQTTDGETEQDNLITYDSANTEEELVSKLLAILNQSQHLTQGDLGIGYIYNPPMTSPFSHTLNCTECGHMYTISTHPSLKLIPLPVYLTDTEYEMIKGIYVDIFL